MRRPKTRIQRLKLYCSALASAIGDRELELEHGVGTVMYFDTDAVLGAVFLFRNTLAKYRALANAIADRRPNAEAEHGLLDQDLVRSLWPMGHFGEVRMLSPHVLELLEQTRHYAADPPGTTSEVDWLIRQCQLAPIIERFEAIAKSESLSGEELLVAAEMLLRELGWKQFVGLDAVTLPKWEARLDHARQWLLIPDQPESSIAELAQIPKTWEIRAAIRQHRASGPPASTDRDFIDATAVVSFRREMDTHDWRTTREIHRFHSQTTPVLDAVCELFVHGQLDLHCDSEWLWERDECTLAHAARTSEYLVIRTCFDCLRFDRPADREPPSIEADRREIAELRKLLENLRDLIREADREPTVSTTTKSQLRAALLLLEDMNAQAFRRGVVLDPRKRSASELVARRKYWRRAFDELHQLRENEEPFLSERTVKRYQEELQELREYRNPSNRVLRVGVPGLKSKVVAPRGSLVRLGMARWLGGLGFNARTNPQTELLRASDLVRRIADSSGHELAGDLADLEKSLAFEALYVSTDVFSVGESLIACSIAWLMGGLRMLSAGLDAHMRLLQEQGNLTEREVLSFETLALAGHSVLGHASILGSGIESEASKATDLVRRVQRLASTTPDERVSSAMILTGISWACALAVEHRSSRLLYPSQESGVGDPMIAIGLEAAELAHGMADPEPASVPFLDGLAALPCGSALLLLACSVPRPADDDLWMRRAVQADATTSNCIWLVDSLYWHRFVRSERGGRMLERIASEAIKRTHQCLTINLLEPHQRRHLDLWTRVADGG